MKFDIPEDWIRLAARRESEMPEISFSVRTNYRGVQAMKHTPEAMRTMAGIIGDPGLMPEDIRNRAAAMLREIADEWEAEEKVSAVKVMDSERNATNFVTFFKDKCEALYFHFGNEAIDLYNRAVLSAAQSPEGGV